MDDGEEREGGGIGVPPTRVPTYRREGADESVEEADSSSATLVTPPSRAHPVDLDAVSSLDVTGFDARYLMRSILGRGGMGEVRLCRDNLVGREVAIKVMHTGEGSQSPSPARFVREARIQGQLEHPAIVPVYTLGQKPDGSAFFTMKRVRGRTLEEVLKGLVAGDKQFAERYSPRKLLTAFSTLCLAVDFAHSRGVVHRDLKPTNVMLGDFGEVYVLDWGLAKISEEQEDPEEKALDIPLVTEAQTLQGSLMGTPGYLAPECIRGARPADARSDVYALGCVLFELLTWEPLHGRDKPMALLASTLVGADARASVRAPQREIPPELDAICVKATALNRDKRYRSARALHHAVERVLDGDRDLELRRQLAARHVRAAAEAAERARSEGSSQMEERRNALREVGRALALEPTNAEAMETMVGLLMEPPREIPPEARDQLDRSAREHARLVARMGGYAYLLLILFIPLFLWMGVREWIWGAVILMLGTCSIIINIVHSRRPRFSRTLQYTLLGVSTLAVLAGSRLLGPFMLLPCLAIVNTIGFVITPTRAARTAFIAFGCASVAIPAVLDWTGVWAPSYLFDQGNLAIVPRLTGLAETPTMVFLLLSHLAVIITAAVVIGRVRDDLTAAEGRLQLYSWQLQQLLPQEARAAGFVEQNRGPSGHKAPSPPGARETQGKSGHRPPG